MYVPVDKEQSYLYNGFSMFTHLLFESAGRGGEGEGVVEVDLHVVKRLLQDGRWGEDDALVTNQRLALK